MKKDWNILLRKRLTARIGEDDIMEVTYLTQGEENNPVKEALYALLFDSDDQVAENAVWIFAHFDRANNEWLYDKHDALIDEAMRTPRIPKRRMLLGLLLRQPFYEETIRTDFLDFCLERMMAAAEPVGIRAYCMKLAYLQCRFFPDLPAMPLLSGTAFRTKTGAGNYGTRIPVSGTEGGPKKLAYGIIRKYPIPLY